MKKNKLAACGAGLLIGIIIGCVMVMAIKYFMNSYVKQEKREDATYEKNISAFEGIKNWDTLSNEDKGEALEAVVLYECRYLGIPKLNFAVQDDLPEEKVSTYDERKYFIGINSKVVEGQSEEIIVKNVLMSCYTAYVFYLTYNIDWNKQVSNAAYFNQARTWKKEIDNHNNDTDGFAHDAQEYACNEYKRIMTIIMKNK